jgi:single-strand DNA-binding protein
MLSGFLGMSPSIRYMPNGTAVVNFTVATSERYTDKTSGEKKTSTEWHRCFAYDKTAENIAKYFKKGSGIIIPNGKLKTREYMQDEIKRFVTEIEVIEFEFPPVALAKPVADQDESIAPPIKTKAPDEPQESSFKRDDVDIPHF